MNPITAKNIHRHELIGLKVEIIQSTDEQLIGIKGEIIDETHHTLIINKLASLIELPREKKSVMKKNCSFRFTLPSGDQVDVDGNLLDSKSENRLKNIIRKRW